MAQKNPLFGFICCLLSLGATAQNNSGLPNLLQSPASSVYVNYSDFTLEIDTVATNIGVLSDVDLTGFNTYRLYITTTDSSDQISAVYGNINEPSTLNCTGDIFQSFPVGGVTASGIQPSVWSAFPSNEYDSFVTIGIDAPANSGIGQGEVNVIESSQNPWSSVFEPGSGAPGGSFGLTDPTGGSWFALPSFNNGIAGPDLRVLLAQITTNGDLSGNLHVQIFLQGDNLNGTIYLNLPLPIAGCTNPSAPNFAVEATVDDGSCTAFGCTDPNAVNFNPNATIEDGSCQHLCVGTAGCIYPDATNYNPSADCDNGTCTFLISSGSCMLDQDNNGFIGSYDLIFFLTLYGLPCSN